MKKLKFRLQMAWQILTAKRFIFIYVQEDSLGKEEVITAFLNMQYEDIVIHCDLVADEAEEKIRSGSVGNKLMKMTCPN